MNKFKFLITLCLFIMFSVVPLSGCKDITVQGITVYLEGSNVSTEDGDDTIVVRYGQLDDLKSYIYIKELLYSGEEREIEQNFIILTDVPLNNETSPGFYGADIKYKDYKPVHIHVKIIEAETVGVGLQIEESYQYSSYTLPTLTGAEGRSYTLYFSNYKSYSSGRVWETNTIPLGKYYAWASIDGNKNYLSGLTDFYSFTITEKLLPVPTVKGTYVYDGTEHNVEFENFHESELNITGILNSTTAGEYEINFTPKENFAWQDGSKTTKTVIWNIAKKKLELPTLIGEYVYNGNQHTPQFTEYENEFISLRLETGRINANTYAAVFSVKYPNNYEFIDGSTSKIIYWEIKKANLYSPSETIDLNIKKASNISNLSELLPENYCLYNETSLPDGLNFNWIYKSETTEGDNTYKFYVSSNLSDIYWVKKEQYLNGLLIETTYYQEGNFKNEICLQEIYLTYNIDKTNYNSVVLVTNISLKDKTEGKVNLILDGVNGLTKISENNYELNYNKTTNQFSSTSNIGTSIVYYKNKSTQQVIETGFKDVGEYEIWAEITETEDYASVKTDIITVKVLAGEITKINNLETTEIEYLSTLAECTITGEALYFGEVEGSFIFEDSTIMPSVADSNLTEYDFMFIPTDSNIKTYYGSTKIIVNKGKLTFITPTVSKGSIIKQGTNLKDLVVENDGIATNSLGDLVDGTWELISSTGLMHEYPEFIFIPNNSNYETKEVKDNNNSTRINKISRLKSNVEPTIHSAFYNGEDFGFWQQGGRFAITYASTGEIDYVYYKNASSFTVTQYSSGTINYTLHYANNTLSCGTTTLAPTINSLEEFKEAMKSTTGVVYSLNCDISLDEDITATTQKVIVISKGKTLNLNSYKLDFTSYSLESYILNYGTLIGEAPNTDSIAYLYALENYSSINLAQLCSYNSFYGLYIKNKGDLKINYAKNYFNVNNYSNITINSSSNLEIVLTDENTKATTTINSTDVVTFGGYIYGITSINAEESIIRKHETFINSGATLNAKNIKIESETTFELNSKINANIIGGSNRLNFYVDSVEKLTNFLSINLDKKYLYIVNDIDLTGVTHIVDGNSIPESGQVALKFTYTVDVDYTKQFNLGGKHLVLENTQSTALTEFFILGYGKILNGTITHGVGTIGSPYLGEDIVKIKYENITFINATEHETTAKTSEEFITAINLYNGRDVNINLTTDVLYESDLTLNGPIKITIASGKNLTIANNKYLTLNFTEDGKHPVIYGKLITDTKISIIQYDEDFVANGFNYYNIFVNNNTGLRYKAYKIKDVADFATLKSLASLASSTSTYTVLRITDSITFPESLTLPHFCRMVISNKSSSTGTYATVDLNGYILTLGYANEDSFASIENVDCITAHLTGTIKYVQNSSRLETTKFNASANSIELTRITSNVIAEASIYVNTFEEFENARSYSHTSVRGFLTTSIYIQTNTTLRSNITLNVDKKHSTHLIVKSGYTLDFDGYSLSLPFLNYISSSGYRETQYSSITVYANATIADGTIRWNSEEADISQINQQNGSILTNITIYKYL